MSEKKPKIVIVGGGLVGCLFALRMHETNAFDIHVYEKRPDSRKLDPSLLIGKSINLALSVRGLTALGDEIKEKLHKIGVKMPRRIIHRQDESIHYQNYGRNRNEYLLSVSRRELNELLMTEAESKGVKFHFGYKCIGCDLVSGDIRFTTKDYLKNEDVPIHFVRNVDLIVGADGAFSCIRHQLSKFGRFNVKQEYITHGYSQFTINPRSKNDSNDLSKTDNSSAWEFEETLRGGREKDDEEFVQGLHIWSRNDFMMIALPNYDFSYTVTLFFRFLSKSNDKPGYDQLNTDEEILQFFKTKFPDAERAMPNIVKDYRNWKPSGLVTIKCEPHHYGNKCLLIGDAAHAIVPFFGQGVNAGFEDVRKFIELYNESKESDPLTRLQSILPKYTEIRKKDLDTISDLAIEHFEDMKKNTTSEDYFKKIRYENDLHEQVEGFVPLYSLITFSNRSYYESLQKSKLQDQLIEETLKEYPMHFERVYGTETSHLEPNNSEERSFLISIYRKKVEERHNLLY